MEIYPEAWRFRGSPVELDLLELTHLPEQSIKERYNRILNRTFIPSPSADAVLEFVWNTIPTDQVVLKDLFVASVGPPQKPADRGMVRQLYDEIKTNLFPGLFPRSTDAMSVFHRILRHEIELKTNLTVEEVRAQNQRQGAHTLDGTSISPGKDSMDEGESEEEDGEEDGEEDANDQGEEGGGAEVLPSDSDSEDDLTFTEERFVHQDGCGCDLAEDGPCSHHLVGAMQLWKALSSSM
ncbi:hypothetical protein B0H17DRAFT_1202511 [Mycena rosella]|uniref:Uncharacterized protein n=1 Tax=Mycena rosella TaxID=1033263 RepID=A0AAD7GFW9_MYCRO|nr:hypothetical protein B0H17DRAFT_1202511 [Mycena rosella]